MARTVPVDVESIEIGRRARRIRRRRGLSLDVVAGLAGFSKSYLSMLEKGQRGFHRRGLVEDLARTLGCSVTDLTGQPYLPVDRDTADALAAVPGIQVALHDYGPDDVPDVRPRPLDELIAWAQTADGHIDQAWFSLAGRDLGTLITELQAHALTTGSADRTRAFTALIMACIVAGQVAKNVGNSDLAVIAATRAYGLARSHDDPGLLGFACYSRGLQLIWLGARTRATATLTDGIDQVTPAVRLSAENTLSAEMLGMMHLTQALTAAHEKRSDDAHAHFAEATQLATRLGERNGMGRHFGPTNVALWRLGAGIELGEGVRAYEDLTRAQLDVPALGSRERCGALHLDAARALMQDGPDRHAEVIRHLDTADRLAPQRTRRHPIARGLVIDLDRRTRRRVWELDSLCNRFGIGVSGSQRVKN
ncbi:MAG: helix-turn-helix domain-containing protein [Pseudonocardiaceae bacterium]